MSRFLSVAFALALVPFGAFAETNGTTTGNSPKPSPVIGGQSNGTAHGNTGSVSGTSIKPTNHGNPAGPVSAPAVSSTPPSGSPTPNGANAPGGSKSSTPNVVTGGTGSTNTKPTTTGSKPPGPTSNASKGGGSGSSGGGSGSSGSGGGAGNNNSQQGQKSQ